VRRPVAPRGRAFHRVRCRRIRCVLYTGPHTTALAW
jgi:hypothetical protein